MSREISPTRRNFTFTPLLSYPRVFTYFQPWTPPIYFPPLANSPRFRPVFFDLGLPVSSQEISAVTSLHFFETARWICIHREPFRAQVPTPTGISSFSSCGVPLNPSRTLTLQDLHHSQRYCQFSQLPGLLSPGGHPSATTRIIVTTTLVPF